MTAAFEPDDLQQRADGVRALARRLVGDEHRADDVIQQALAAATVRSAPAIHSPGAWLRGAVRNLALRARRDEDTRRRYEHAAPVRPAPGDPAEVVARAELHGLVMHALLALDEPYRSTLLRRFFDGLSAVEIAREQGVPAATVRTRIHRGLQRLREGLDRDHGDRRAWSLLLLPLLAHPRPPAPVAPPLSSTGPIAAGAAVMSAKKLAVVIAAVLVTAVAWWAGSGPSGSDTESAETATADADADVRREHVATSPPTEPEPVDPLPDPIDFAAVDIDLDLHGRVIDAKGAPIPGARVEVFQRPWHNRRVLMVRERDRELPLSETQAARDGSFSVRLARGERVTLRASREGFAPTEMPLCLAGQRLDVTLHAGVTLAVSVLGPDGKPLQGAEVSLVRSSDNFAGLPGVQGNGVTDAKGICRMSGLPPRGSGTLTVGHALGVVWLANVLLPESGETSTELRLPAGRTINGVVRDAATGKPIPGARVADQWTQRRAATAGDDGRFALPNATWETFALWALAEGYAEASVRIEAETDVVIEMKPAVTALGRLLDPDGNPIAEARIAIISERGTDLARVNVHGESGADGRFSIEGLAPDAPHVVIVMADGLSRYLTDVDPAPAGTPLDVGDITVPTGRRVSGRAVDATGAALANVVVKLNGANADRSRLRANGRPVAEFYGTEETCWTDDRGRFHFTDVAPGTYDISAVARGRKNASAVAEVAAEDIDGIELTFVGGNTFGVRVEDDEGNPVAMVSVTARTADEWSLTVPTRADGRVEFESDSPVVSVQAFSWNNGDLRYVAGPAQRVAEDDDEAVIVMKRVRAVNGRVLRPDGKPLAHGQFHVIVNGEVMRQESPFDSYGYVRATGEFRALVPTDAEAVIELVNCSYEDESTGAVLRVVGRAEGVTSEDDGIVIRAEAPPADRSFSLRVVGPDEHPIAGATVKVNLSYTSQARPAVVTGRSGRAFIEGVQAAEHVVTVELPAGHPGRSEWAALSELARPGEEELVLRFRAGERVAGRVVDVNGAPVVGATIHVYANQKQLVTHTSDGAGEFAFAVAPDAPSPLYLFAYLRDGEDYVEFRDAAFRPSRGLRLVLRAP